MTEHYLDRLARTINENWDQPALTDFYLTEDNSAQDTSRGNHYTYGEMYEEILHVCDIFSTLGLQKGDHIAICGANSAHWAIAYLAIAAYQGVAVTVLHSQSPEDIARQIAFSDAKALCADPDLWDTLSPYRPILSDLSSVISLADWSLVQSKSSENRQSADGQPTVKAYVTATKRQCQFSHGEPDDLAMICFTSGSTGMAKGVMLSYVNLYPSISFNIEVFARFRNKPFLSIVPYAHLLGLVAEILQPLCIGINVYILKAFDFKNLLYAYKVIRPVFIVSVPSVLNKIISIAKQGDDNLNSIKEKIINMYGGDVEIIGIGGAIFDEEDEQLIYNSQLPVIYGYGATECGPRIAIFRDFNFSKKGSSGLPLPNTEIKISPTGEILVKGENVMLGYYKDPEATARKIDKDGWLHTGDKGHLDEDGYLYVEGRLSQDMIVLPNGENIHPEDIERKINALPVVKESIVLARDGKLVAIVVADADVRRHVLRAINPKLPLYSQLYDVEITDTPLQKTEKQTIKRYLYK